MVAIQAGTAAAEAVVAEEAVAVVEAVVEAVADEADRNGLSSSIT